jgi:nitrous oxidase accessory protein NosD
LSGLYIHDINGDNKKGSKEGNGIFWDCRGPKPSNIENLVIENCRLLRVDRNGIRGNGTFAFRNNWFPNKNLVIRGCTLEDIGGDGIVIKAFDGALVERNKLFYTRTRAKDNAVGIWPHSSDNTVIQYNEVAYTKNVNWANDGQSFDIDGNCNHTIIQNNYSHDNEGGFMLVISDAIDEKSRMTTNNIIRNNLSVNDGNNRRRLFNFALVTDHTHVYGNIFYNQSAEPFKMELIDIEHGIPKDIVFEDNLFLYRGGVIGIFTKSAEQYRAVTWENNVFKGNIKGKSNLLQVTEAKATSVSSKNLNEYPWMFLKSLNLKN